MTPNSTRKPNVIWVFGDQHRAHATGYMGDPNVRTPNMDRLAAEGVVFTAAVSGSPVCCPYRGSLLTGVYPHRCVPAQEVQMPADQPTIAHAFRQADYHTAYFGKWHLDGFHEHEGRAAMHIIPPHRRGGFDTWIGYENNNSQYDCWVHGAEGKDSFHYRLPGYETDALTDLLINHITQQGEAARAGQPQPFFAALSVQPPHSPYVAPERWMQEHTPAAVQLRANVPQVARIIERARRDLAGYYAMIENLDWNLGRIRAALSAAGLADHTHIMFFSDHGDMHGSHGQFAKSSPWEEAIRIPFIIGGGVPFYGVKGGRHAVPINHVDVAPTTLGLCGINKPSWMPGTDYSGYRCPHRPITNEPDSAYLQLCAGAKTRDGVDRPWRGVVTRDGWKYVVLEHQPWLMFNLNEDPYELVNLAHNRRFTAERKRLHDRLAAWVHDTADSFSLPGISSL